MKKIDQVRTLLAQGFSAPEIAKKVKVKPAYVHTVKWMDKKKKPSKIVKAVTEVKQALDLIEKKPKEDPKAKEWAKNNPWFGKSKPRTAYALGLHEELVRSGVNPKSDEYYKRIDEAMSIFPGKEKKKYRMQAAFEPVDPVNHPPHYKSGGIETIDFIEAKDLNYRLGNVVKYVSRAGRKDTDPVQDLEKAAWYLQREITARKGA